MANKWLKQLKKYDDTVDHTYDAFASENCIYSPSPYFNWLYANKSGGIPKGTGTLFFSEPKAGKSLMIQAIVAELHQRDPEAIAIVWNTEMRGKYQKGLFKGIDPERFIVYDTNEPAKIFDRWKYEILPMIEDGMPVRLVGLDSITMIGGTKAEGKSVNDHLVGDKALTKSRGWDLMIPDFKRLNIPYFGVEQMRANIGGGTYAPDKKMAADLKTKHIFEYFISIRRANNTSAGDKQSLDGEKFEDSEIKDAAGNKDAIGHKIALKMEESSLGTAGRTGKLTIKYDTGIVNQHEEVFELGKNCNILERPNNTTYIFEGETYRGKAAMANAIKDNPELANKILAKVRELDNKEKSEAVEDAAVQAES